MRGFEIQQRIIGAIEAIVPDDAASVADRFTFVDDDERSVSEAAPDRANCRLLQGPASPSTTFSPMTVRAGFRLEVPYTSAPGLRRRMLSDGERIIAALYALHGDDLMAVELGDWIPTPGEADNQVICQLDIFATYNLTLPGV